MPDPRTNGAYSTVASSPGSATSGTIGVQTGDGARFAVGTFDVTVVAASQQPVFVAGSGVVNAEIVRVSRAAGSDSLTFVSGGRQRHGTSLRTIAVGDQIFQGPSVGWGEDVLGYPSYGQDLGLSNMYDRVRGAYNWKSSNTRKADQSLGRVMSGGMAEHVWIGDSLSAGIVSLSGVAYADRLNSVPMSFQNALANAGAPANGTGFVRAADGNGLNDSRWVFTGTWSNGGAYQSTNTLNSSATFTPNRGGSFVDIVCYDYASTTGTVGVQVDGVTVGTITLNGTNRTPNGADGATGYKIFRFAANVIKDFSQIKLTLTAIATTGGGFILMGAEVWAPNAGLRMHNLAQSGSTASGTGLGAWSDSGGLWMLYQPVGGSKTTLTDVATTSGANTITSATGGFVAARHVGMPIDQVPSTAGLLFPPNSYISGVTSTTVATVSYTKTDGTTANANASATASAQTFNIGRVPDCIHIALGINDLSSAVAATTITAAIQTIRNNYPNSDCILHLTPEENSATVSTSAQLAFQQAMFQLADSLDVPLIDWRDQVGTFTTGQAQGWYGDPNVHLSAPTYMMVGSTVASMFGPGAGRSQATYSPINDNDNLPYWFVTRNRTTTATATATTTSEGVVLQIRVPPNTFKVGSTIRYDAMLSPAATTVTTTRLRIGTAGTTADAAVVAMSATAATNTAVRRVDGNASIQATGASGTFLGIGTESVGAISAAGTATATSGTFDTTKPLYISLTVQNGTSTTTTVKSGLMELVP